MFDAFLRLLAHILVPMFIVGMAGSSIIVVSTLAGDFADFLSDSGSEDSSSESLS